MSNSAMVQKKTQPIGQARSAKYGAALALAFCCFNCMAASPSPATIDAGRQLFHKAVPACAICHTLADAQSTGAIGPVLDEIKPDAARVEMAIRNGIGQMPAYTTLSDEEIKALSAYVARAAAKE